MAAPMKSPRMDRLLALAALALAISPGAALGVAGEPDASLGGAGTAVQGDGKLVVAGTTPKGIGVARFTEGGLIDPLAARGGPT